MTMGQGLAILFTFLLAISATNYVKAWFHGDSYASRLLGILSLILLALLVVTIAVAKPTAITLS